MDNFIFTVTNRDIMEKLLKMDEKTLQKKRAQVKSRWYYIFWGIATVSVVSGQIYVGSGYRYMADSIDTLIQRVKS